MNVFDLAAKLTLDTSEYEKELASAGKSADQLGDKAVDAGNKMESGLGKKGKLTGALIGAGLAAAGAAVVGLAKQSSQYYAEYEQLAGGSQLLFGDAYDFIAEKAASAYQTVQMSQSDYLRQVNGFATGLKTALGGDEQAAAELADRILTAEADIVAATGNSQEAVQNAFNGIMKSNYNMLDNLQLGINPTKEGMQEVIDKVNEWNETNGRASNYVIDNLADVQSALVDYVEMQGLAGYAADEAAGTIQGSLSQVKSAWENLLTGFATEGADLDVLFDNFFESATTVVENVAPVIGRAVAAIISGIVTHIPDILQALATMIDTIFVSLGAELDKFLEVGVAWLQGIMDGINSKVNDLAAAAHELWVNFKETLHSKITEALEQGVEWITNLIQGIKDKISDTIAAGTELWQNFKSNLASFVGEILAIGVEWIANLIQGIRNKIADTVQAGRDLIEQVKSTIRNAVANFREIGGQLMEGLKQGIANKVQSIISSVRGAVQDAIAAAKRLLGIASPSKVFAEIGEYLDEGLAKGIEDKGKEPLQRIKDLANEIIAVVEGMNKKVNSTLTQTAKDVAYIANMDYSAAMLKAENIEEFQGLAKLRDAKIAGEGIDLSAEGWKSNDDLLKEWQESLAVVDGMNKKVKSTLAQTAEDVAYIANMDYSAAMLKAENIEEFQGLAKLRDAKIAGEGIDSSAEGWKSNDDLLKEWQESLDKQTAAMEKMTTVTTQGTAGEYSDLTWQQPINIAVKLDGKVVGEAAYKYGKMKARMVGA